MLNISLCFNRKDFEYDVYSLIKAFYPGCEITSWYEEDGAPDGEFAYYDKILYAADQICFSIENEKHEELSAACEAVEYEKDRHETKNVLKRMVYRTLSEVSGKELPWGDLTGIRPTKIPMKMLEEGKTNVEIAKYMRETYYTSPEKTALAITIANREKDILKTIDYEHGYSLYIGIPFCPSICLYCSFGSHVLSRWEHMVDPYLDALIKELIFISENMKDYTLDTIYIGGGTPTTLNAAQMERLLSKVTELFPMDQVQEFTVEAGRPDTINEEVLKAIRKFPVTRISINPQTMNQETLDLIGRHHTVEEIEERNILGATFLAMNRAIAQLSPQPTLALIDGNRNTGITVPSRCIVGGDGKCADIAAASVLAKVTRDRYMRRMAETYPQYGFEKHKGYGTAAHYAAIRAYGPCPIHRPSFLKKMH